MTVEAKDIRGVAIEPGDTIVYPGRFNSSLWLNEAVVVDVKSYNERIHNYGGTRSNWSRGEIVATRVHGGKQVTITEIGRVAVVEKAKKGEAK